MSRLTCLTIIAAIAFLYLIISRICESIERSTFFRPLRPSYQEKHETEFDEYIEDIKNKDIERIDIDNICITIKLADGNIEEIYTNDKKVIDDYKDIQRKLEVKNNGR